MQAVYPGESTEASRAGVCGHKVGADLLYKPGTREKYVGHYKIEGVVVDDEIFDAAEFYANEVMKIAGYDARVEERISAPTIHLESFGTCDAWYYDEKTNTLYIWDFKLGFASVDAFEHWQLINYAAGVLFNPNEKASNAYHVVLTIVQPRDYREKVKTWATNVDKLSPYFDRLRESAENVFSEKPTIRSGDHCRYCRARHACEAARQSAFSAFEYSCEPIPIELTPDQLGRELEILERCKNAIEYRYDALRTQVEQMIRNGKNIPQWALQPKSHRTEWKISVEDIENIATAYKTKLTKTTPITPKQAIKAGIPKEVVDTLTKTKPGKQYLTHYDVRKESERFSHD
jgi:hypothetical protein